MVVKELIEQLKQLDENMEVWYDNDGRYEKANGASIESNGYAISPYNVVIVR